MIIDDKGKIFGKVSIVDIAVILLVLALIGGAYYKFFLLNQAKAAIQLDVLRYQVVVKEIREPSVDALKKTDDVYDDRTGSYMGKIVKRTVMPAVDYIEKTDGTIVKAQIPGKYDMKLTIEAPGIETKHGFFANGNIEIKRGSKLKLTSKLIAVEAQVEEIEKVRLP